MFIVSYMLYIFFMFILALGTYHQIYVLKQKSKLNKIQLFVYSLTLLSYAFLLGFGKGLVIFNIVVTSIYSIMFFLEGHELGRVKAKFEESENSKKDVALKVARGNCILTGLIFFMSLGILVSWIYTSFFSL